MITPPRPRVTPEERDAILAAVRRGVRLRTIRTTFHRSIDTIYAICRDAKVVTPQWRAQYDPPVPELPASFWRRPRRTDVDACPKCASRTLYADVLGVKCANCRYLTFTRDGDWATEVHRPRAELTW